MIPAKRPVETKLLRFEIKEAAEDGSFSGVLSVYDVVDQGGDTVDVGAFTKTLQESGGRVPCLYRHTDPIGMLDCTDTGKALEVKGQLILDTNPDGSPAVPEAYKALALMRRGVLKGLSIGFIAVKAQVINGVRHLKELALKEGSVVVVPMLSLAQITSVKDTNSMEQKMDFTEALDNVQTWSARYDYMSALDAAVSSCMTDEAMTTEDCTKQIAASCDQFKQSMMDLCPKLRTLLNATYGYDFKKLFELERKAGRKLSADSRSKITECMKQLQALLDDGAAMETAEAEKSSPAETKGTPNPEAATPSTEPVDHSQLISKFNELKGAFQWNLSK